MDYGMLHTTNEAIASVGKIVVQLSASIICTDLSVEVYEDF